MKKILSVFLSSLIAMSCLVFTAPANAQETENSTLSNSTQCVTEIKTPAQKIWSVVEGDTVNAPVSEATETNIAGLTLTPVWEGADGFSFGQKVSTPNVLIAYTATYSLPEGYAFDACLTEKIENSVISSDDRTFTMKLYTYVIPKNAIYVSDNGSDTEGEFEIGNIEKPCKTVEFAMTLLDANGGGVIVVTDILTESSSSRSGARRTSNYTIMGWSKNSIWNHTDHYHLRANTSFRDLNIQMGKATGGIYLNGYALTLGDRNYTDLITTSVNNGSKQLMMMANDSGASYTNPGKLTINSGSYSNVIGSGWGKATVYGSVEIEINGGEIGALYAGSFCGASTISTVQGNITLTVNGGKITTLSLGSMYARYHHTGDFNATINGGTIHDILFRTASGDTVVDGQSLPVQNGDYILTINGGTITGSITNTSTETTGVTGQSIINLYEYTGDKQALLSKIDIEQFDEVNERLVHRVKEINTPAKKIWSVVDGAVVNAPQAIETETDVEGIKLTPVWEGINGFTFGQRVSTPNELIAYTATYTLPENYIFDISLTRTIENSVISNEGRTLTQTLYSYVIPKDAIYVDDGGSDSTDDYAEGNFQKPYKTVDYAMKLLEGRGGGVVVIVGSATDTLSWGTERSGHYTIMGWDENSTWTHTDHFHLRADTTFRDLNIRMGKKDGGIYLNNHSLTLGDENYTDLVVTTVNNGSKQIMLGTSGTGTFTNPGKLTINSGSYGYVISSGWSTATVKGDVEIEINGGSIINLFAGLFCGASSVHSITGDVILTVNGGNITTLGLGSLHPRYLHNGNCMATINGGTIKDIIFRSGSADVEVNSQTLPVQNGDYTLKINGGTITGSITDTSTGTTGVTGHTIVDLLDYNGNRPNLLAKIATSQFDDVRYMVVYVDQKNGKETNDGLTPDAPLPTLTAALSRFAGGVSGKVVIMGEVTTNAYDEATGKYTDVSYMTDTAGRGPVTITGFDEDAKLVICTSTVLKGDTTFENIHIVNSAANSNLYAGGFTLTMGEGITNSTTVGHHLQIGNGAGNTRVAKGNIIIHSGTYGLIYTGADFNSGSVTGDTSLTIYDGTFTGDVYAGGYVAAYKLDSVAGNTSLDGTIGGKIGLYIHGGTFQRSICIGGNQYGTIGSAEVKITGGTFTGDLVAGVNRASGTSGSGTAYTTDILGNMMINISGGTFSGTISHSGNGVHGKSVLIASNAVELTVTNPEKFNYAVLTTAYGKTTYDPATDKFTLVPDDSSMDIYVNGTIIQKAGNNIYTLSGVQNNLYNIKYGGQTSVSAKFIITPPMAELTPITEVIKTGGPSTYNDIGNCSVSSVTWEPAHEKFRFDTEYTAKVTLTAVEGIEFGNDLTNLYINNKSPLNTVSGVLSEDKSQLIISVKFPKTEKSDFDKLAQSKSNVRVLFTTMREGTNPDFFRDTTVTLTNLANNDLTVSGKATENGTEGIFTAEVACGLYDITVKKNGYLKATVESVMIDSSGTVTVDAGKLIPGDIISTTGEVAGDDVIDIDDYSLTLRSFNPDAKDAVKKASDINEMGLVTVTQLNQIKRGFSKTTVKDATKFAGLFENTYYKLTVDKKLTIGYIGGSIIQGAGAEYASNEAYIDRMHTWFNENFPDAEIHSINAGISNTGSNFANFRLEKDLMLRDEGYIPDLVFLEFCVNDFAIYGADHIEMLYESLIRNVYRINPNADIVCLLSAFSGYATGKNAHIKIANHYDIPILDLGAPMYTHYNKAGDCKIFTNDNLHPNGMGYEFYAKLTKNLLEKYIILGAPVTPTYNKKVLPEQVCQQLLTNPKAIPITDASIIKTGTWKAGSTWTGSRIFSPGKGATHLASSTAGDTFTFTFNGDAFGFMVSKSAAMGTLEYQVDGGAWRECNFGDTQRYTHCQIYMPGTVTSDEPLSFGQHTVTVRVTGNKSHPDSTGCEVAITGILYNASPSQE